MQSVFLPIDNLNGHYFRFNSHQIRLNYQIDQINGLQLCLPYKILINSRANQPLTDFYLNKRQQWVYICVESSPTETLKFKADCKLPVNASFSFPFSGVLYLWFLENFFLNVCSGSLGKLR